MQYKVWIAVKVDHSSLSPFLLKSISLELAAGALVGEVVYVVGLGQRLGQSLMGYVVELGDFYGGKLVCIGGRL